MFKYTSVVPCWFRDLNCRASSYIAGSLTFAGPLTVKEPGRRKEINKRWRKTDGLSVTVDRKCIYMVSDVVKMVSGCRYKEVVLMLRLIGVNFVEA